MFNLVFGSVVLVLGLAIARKVGQRRKIPDLGSNEWMALQHGLALTLADDPALSRYAQRSRRWRLYGIVGGLFGTYAWAFFPFHDGLRSANPFVGLVVGWFVAGVLPELFVRNRPKSELRVAALEERSVRRYVNPTAWHWLAGSVVLTISAVVIRQTVTVRVGPSRADTAMVLAASVLLALIGATAVKRIAKRPQPAGGPDDVLVDETIRGLATTRTMSGWSALQFIAAAYLAPRGFFPHADLVHNTILVISFIGLTASWAWVPTRMMRRSSAVADPA